MTPDHLSPHKLQALSEHGHLLLVQVNTLRRSIYQLFATTAEDEQDELAGLDLDVKPMLQVLDRLQFPARSHQISEALPALLRDIKQYNAEGSSVLPAPLPTEELTLLTGRRKNLLGYRYFGRETLVDLYALLHRLVGELRQVNELIDSRLQTA